MPFLLHVITLNPNQFCCCHKTFPHTPVPNSQLSQALMPAAFYLPCFFSSQHSSRSIYVDVSFSLLKDFTVAFLAQCLHLEASLEIVLWLWFFNTNLCFGEEDSEKSIMFNIRIVLHLQPHGGNFPYSQESCIVIIFGLSLGTKEGTVFQSF